MSREETMAILEKFFGECLRFWEKELKVSSDLDKEPFINAIKEIPSTHPYRMGGEKLNPEWVAEFTKYRLMDCYGREWEQYA